MTSCKLSRVFPGPVVLLTRKKDFNTSKDSRKGISGALSGIAGTPRRCQRTVINRFYRESRRWTTREFSDYPP